MKWSNCTWYKCLCCLVMRMFTYVCECFRAIYLSSIFAINMLHSLRVSSDRSQNRNWCPRWDSQLEWCHHLIVHYGSKTPYPILLKSIKENQDSQGRKIEKMNSREWTVSWLYEWVRGRGVVTAIYIKPIFWC